jgi:hypothetical protein
VTVTGWPEYAELVRRLNQLYRASRPAPARQDEAAPAAGIDQLTGRLAAQRQRLAQLGRLLGQSPLRDPPDSAAFGPFGRWDVAGLLALAGRSADVADAVATEVETLAQSPPLLRGWPPLGRALLVYLGCAGATVLAQTGLLVAADHHPMDTWTLLGWLYAGLPAMAFFAGYAVLSVWGKPLIGAEVPARYPRLGWAMCFLILPTIHYGHNLFG